ncbi:MAG: FAD-dependent oxidoreductase [Pseudomonadota bacterium]
MKFDCIVLGAGMVGVSTALHLQQRGRSVALVDRRPAAEETSYGNAGLIQCEGVVPYPFPRSLRKVFNYALNRTTEAHLHYSALPSLAPWLYAYWRHGTEEKIAQTSRAALPLVNNCLAEHEALMQEAGIEGMLRRTGYLRVYREQASLDADVAAMEEERQLYGVNYEALDPAKLKELEPHLTGDFAGGMHLVDPASVADPNAVGKAYAELFTSKGGAFLTGDADTLEAIEGGWQVQNVEGPITARDCVIALGPWSAELLARLDLRVPLASKRGYHMHYSAKGNATLGRPVLDTDYGFVLAPMSKGIRLTTGAEFARHNAPPTPRQLEQTEPIAKQIFPLADRAEPKPWLGRRPCLPDMLAMIGGVPGKPGLWANFGHHHLGFTLGPVTGRLLAEIITQQPTFCDIHPYRVDRF